jgi:hypothetical protein
MTDQLLQAKKAAAEAEAAFIRAVAAYQEMATGRHRERVSLAIAEIGLAHARAAVLEYRDVSLTQPSNDAMAAFDTAFGVARRAAITAARTRPRSRWGKVRAHAQSGRISASELPRRSGASTRTLSTFSARQSIEPGSSGRMAMVEPIPAILGIAFA